MDDFTSVEGHEESLWQAWMHNRILVVDVPEGIELTIEQAVNMQEALAGYVAMMIERIGA